MWLVGAAILSLIIASGCLAAEAIVTDADTLVLQGKPLRLGGIDAPETDQVCLDKSGRPWACGIEAREQLKKFIRGRDVRCPGTKFDPVYRNRRIAVCTVEGETVSINEWLVREGWAVNFEPYARGPFTKVQEDARSGQRGLWSGCFAPPQAQRRWEKREASLLGSGCDKIDDAEAQRVLFPDHPAMPPGCPIKAKLAVRAHFIGHRGIYHLEGCGSHRRLKNPDRWFCSEVEAQAEGFRRALNCKRTIILPSGHRW